MAQNCASRRVHRDRRPLRVLGMGLALPGPAISTEALIARVERNFGIAIHERAAGVAAKLGVETRHLSRDLVDVVEAPRAGDSNADLAARAVAAALQDAGLRTRDLGYLIGHTTTPDTLLPPGIAGVADHLGYGGPFAEFRQACTGFANALVMAGGLLSQPGASPVAIVGSETGSVFFDPRLAAQDRAQLVNMLQMGDGAAAIVLGPDDARGGQQDRLDCLAFGSNGLDTPSGMALRDGGSGQPASLGAVPMFAHDYATILRTGPGLFAAGAAEARRFGIDLASVRALIPHQANGRLGDLVGALLDLPPELVVTMARRVGNMGSAAIWAALAELRPQMRPGETAVVLGAEATKHMFATFRFTKA